MRDFNVQRRHLIDICLSLPAHSPSSPPPVLPLAHVCTPSMHFKKLLLPPSGVPSTEPYRILQEVFTSTRFPSSSTTPECSAVYCLCVFYSWVPHCTTWWRRWFDGSRIQIIYVYPELNQHNINRNRSSGLWSLNVPPHLLLALVVQQWHPIVGQWKSCTARLPLIAVVGVFVNCAAN